MEPEVKSRKCAFLLSKHSQILINARKNQKINRSTIFPEGFDTARPQKIFRILPGGKIRDELILEGNLEKILLPLMIGHRNGKDKTTAFAQLTFHPYLPT
jgi:hypothetical protein